MVIWDTQRALTCCFTGHRPNKLPSGYRQDTDALAPLRMALRQAIVQAADNGYRSFLSGMALGVDTWAAEEVLALREAGREVRLIAALPCPGQDSRWTATDRDRYREMLERADEVHTLSDRYTPFCMGARNLWMTEQSSLLIAVFDGSVGGTANTVAHARRQGLHILRIHPRTGEILSIEETE